MVVAEVVFVVVISVVVVVVVASVVHGTSWSVIIHRIVIVAVNYKK